MQFGLLFIIMILSSFAEVLSIGAVLPFLGALTAPERVFSYPATQPLIHALSMTEPKQLLLPLTLFFAIGAIFSGVMRLTLLWAQTRLSHAIGADFSISIYRRTLYQPYPVHVARNSSEIITAIINKAHGVVYHAILPLLTIFSSVLMMIFIVLALVSIEPVISITAFIGFGVIYAGVIFFTKKTLLRDSQRINYESNQITKALQEGLGGIRDILLNGTQETYCDIYRKADLQLRRATANIAIIGGSPRFVVEALGMVLIAALAYSLIDRSPGITAAIPVLGLLALGAQRLLPVLQQTYSSWSVIRGGQASLADTLNLLDQKLPVYADEKKINSIEFRHSISIRDVHFKYTKDASWVLQDNLNLVIPKGSRIGFIGETGSGKSTLIDVIMGLLQPTSGNLLVDDVVINESNTRAWQARIAHVPQAIFLADASIAENIAFGESPNQIDHIRVRQAAQKAQIADTIESLDQKYQTIVGERGVRLSGGQRQRIGIARALYRSADVIVLDEATSALDYETERSVMNAIENFSDDVTVITIAHRLSTLKKCSQIIELKNGRINRMGSYLSIIGA
jgi:ATP-binding cassette subfamily B protein